jgi:hypothetical protein
MELLLHLLWKGQCPTMFAEIFKNAPMKFTETLMWFSNAVAAVCPFSLGSGAFDKFSRWGAIIGWLGVAVGSAYIYLVRGRALRARIQSRRDEKRPDRLWTVRRAPILECDVFGAHADRLTRV